ncbi:cytochrome P450 [Paraphoma chrysanthemicola]|uniref:Cytochrome P450 n=1 Tax=Paraphoma chrysanthemicola TaxID=798071 RepID=A0A8K0R3Y0_9PLEO|nr:cytochrome P450 [Paraphoma chrysanthemicola]
MLTCCLRSIKLHSSSTPIPGLCLYNMAAFINIPWLLAIAIAAIFLYAANHSRSQNLPDGPSGLPFIGVLPDKKLKLHQQLARFVPRYGDFFSFNMGKSKIVVLSSPTAIEDLIVKKGQNFSSRPSSSSQAMIIAQDRLVQMEYGDLFRKHRKVTHTLLGMQNFKSFMPYQDYESKQTLRILMQNPSGFYQELQRYATSVTLSLLVGARLTNSDGQFSHEADHTTHKMFKYMRPGAWLADWIPVLDYLPNVLAPWRAKAQSFYESLIEFWSVLYDPVANRVKEGNAPDCFVKSFLESPNIESFSEAERRVLFSDIMAAGMETTATSLQFLFKAALLYPDFIKHAQAELDQVVGNDRLPDWDDRPNLPYIKAVIMELHRWCCTTPLSFFHATTREDTYRGKNIPAKTTVIYNTYAVHHNDEYFPQHHKFAPERYLPDSDKRRMVDGAFASVHYAFGAGRRECPGKHVADSSLYIAISRLLWAFNFELGSNPLPSDETAGDVPILGPAEFKCNVTVRSEKAKSVIEAASLIHDPATNIEDGSALYEETLLRAGKKLREL